MKVLITGCEGQLGLHLRYKFKNIKWIEPLITNKKTLDISDTDQVDSYFEKYLPDIVINAAAFTLVDAAEESPSKAFKVNHIGAANLAKASAKYNGVIIQISTDYIFDGNSNRAYIENDSPNPLNIYGLSKLNGEKAVIQFNPKHIILRTSWLFSGVGKNFYLTISNMLNTKKSISVVNDQIGAPTVASDFVDLISKILEKLHKEKVLQWGVYHYAGFPFISWFGFAKHIQKVIYPKGMECEILENSAQLYNSPAKRPLNSSLNSSKACSYFGVEPSDWISGLNKL